MVERVVWECRGGIRDRVRRNAAKPCDTCVCGGFFDCRKRRKSGFDHINDHRQENLWFFSPPWYHSRNWISGYSEVGIAPGLGPGDRAFEPHYSDQKPSEIVGFRGLFLFFVYCGAGGEIINNGIWQPRQLMKWKNPKIISSFLFRSLNNTLYCFLWNFLFFY